MGKFATGVTVLSISQADRIAAMTANAFMSVSMTPALVAVSVAKTARFGACIKVGGLPFGISFLERGQAAECSHFGGRPIGGFEQDFEMKAGAPVLQGALVQIVVVPGKIVEAGDHNLVIAEVQSLCVADKAPLIFYGARLWNQLTQDGMSDATPLGIDFWA